ncbi:1395_t:CDS:2 [Cetraspora pellucida]|uniref:1395_t:CDS:1 n=1 Tax=Cetraspora pellucida TaxID=1433469 RepID=A0A9N9DEK2_9GLOM|nr:1395_t:CDS:2 [Cetraspora pellucida]
MKVNVTLSQMLQYPDQKCHLANVIKRSLVSVAIQNLKPIDMKVMTIQAITITKTTAAYCYIRIKENLIVAVLNSSTTISIILNKITKKLQLKINEPFTTMVIIVNGARVKALKKIINLKLVMSSVVVLIMFQIIELTEQILLLGIDWFCQTGTHLHADKKKLYVQCQGKFIEILKFYKRKILLALLVIKKKSEKLKKPDNEDLFDNFKFDNEDLNEVESSAVYLSGVESVSVKKTKEEEESIIKKLKKNLNNEALTNNQKNYVSNMLCKEVNVFTEIIDDLEQTLAYINEINTKSALLIKQVLYYAASRYAAS